MGQRAFGRKLKPETTASESAIDPHGFHERDEPTRAERWSIQHPTAPSKSMT
jgi:hypothetical protein